jgi:hypothetical protein
MGSRHISNRRITESLELFPNHDDSNSDTELPVNKKRRAGRPKGLPLGYAARKLGRSNNKDTTHRVDEIPDSQDENIYDVTVTGQDEQYNEESSDNGCPIHLAEQASLHGDFGPELHGIETVVSPVCTRSLAPSGYLLTVAAPSSMLPGDTTTEQQFHPRCIPQFPAVLTHIKLLSPYEPTGG